MPKWQSSSKFVRAGRNYYVEMARGAIPAARNSAHNETNINNPPPEAMEKQKMKRRILIATDNEADRSKYEDYLQDFGYEVETADDGMACHRKLANQRPDVLLLESNIKWGGSDGVIEQMRDDPELYAIPVVLITNEQTDDEFAQVIEDPIVASLSKPFPLSELLENVLFADHCTYKAFVEQL